MASETFADELRAAVAGDKFTLYTELMLQAADLLDHKDEQINTRPAPAATETGLVTAKVEHRVHFGEDGNPTEWREGYGMGLYPQEPIVRVEVREYVTRSQAEELLAAERELASFWHKKFMTVRSSQISLEANLAAAEKALKPFSDHAKERAVDASEWRDTDTVQIVVAIGDLRKARAVLGGKPS